MILQKGNLRSALISQDFGIFNVEQLLPYNKVLQSL